MLGNHTDEQIPEIVDKGLLQRDISERRVAPISALTLRQNSLHGAHRQAFQARKKHCNTLHAGYVGGLDGCESRRDCSITTRRPSTRQTEVGAERIHYSGEHGKRFVSDGRDLPIRHVRIWPDNVRTCKFRRLPGYGNRVVGTFKFRILKTFFESNAPQIEIAVFQKSSDLLPA